MLQMHCLVAVNLPPAATTATHNRHAPWLIDQAAITMPLLVAVVLLPAATTATHNRHAPLIDQAASASNSSTTTLK
jgi:hypothetical protein